MIWNFVDIEHESVNEESINTEIQEIVYQHKSVIIKRNVNELDATFGPDEKIEHHGGI